MRSKFLACILTVAFAVLLSSNANAGLLDFSAAYSADNTVTSFTLTGGGDTFNLGSKTSQWWNTTSVSLAGALKPGTQYTATWNVRDASYPGASGTIGSGNPMAFIGQITAGGTTYLSSADSMWQVNGGTATAFSQPGSIWYNAHGFQPSIGNLAAWVSANSNAYGSTGEFSVSATFTTSKTPIPAAFLLLGSGLAGLAGVKRRFRKS